MGKRRAHRLRGSIARAATLSILVATLGACTAGEGGSSTPPPKHPGSTPCAPGERPLADGGCLAAGMQENGCAAGEVGLEGGGCRPAGIPEESCGKGFEPTGDGSCSAVLPSDPCPSGMMAVPGDAACVEVAPCGKAPWGDIPTEASTAYVDAAYAGGDSDGTEQKPWTTIQAAVDAAPDNGLVAVAAGSYAEDVIVQDRTVRIWGRCPSLVEIVGSTAGQAAIEIHPLNVSRIPTGTEIRRVALRGDAYGAFVTSTDGVLLDQVWIHDTAGRGVSVQGGPYPTAATIHGSLVESATGIGVFVAGAEATIDASAIVATRPLADGSGGKALSVRHSTLNGLRAKVTVVGSVLERSNGDGITLSGADGTFEATAIRFMEPTTTTMSGRGMTIQPDPDSGERGKLEMRSSLVEAVRDNGILVVGSDAAIDSLAITGTLAGLDGTNGVGLFVVDDPFGGGASSATLANSCVSGGHGSGIAVGGSDITALGVLVRDVQPFEDNKSGGECISAVEGNDTALPSRFTGRASRLEGCTAAGVLAFGGDVTLEGVAVRDIHPRSDKLFGLGIAVQPSPEGAPSKLTLRSSVVERTSLEGVFVAGSSATLESVLIHDTASAASDARFGRGISIEAAPSGRADAAVRWSRIADNYDAGIFVIGSSATIEATVVEGTAPRPSDGLFGDGIVAHAVLGPTDVTIQGSTVVHSARGGVTSFGGAVSLAGSTLECNAIHLDGEPLDGNPFDFSDLGDNACGCSGAVQTCKVESAKLQPPEASGPPQD